MPIFTYAGFDCDSQEPRAAHAFLHAPSNGCAACALGSTEKPANFSSGGQLGRLRNPTNPPNQPTCQKWGGGGGQLWKLPKSKGNQRAILAQHPQQRTTHSYLQKLKNGSREGQLQGHKKFLKDYLFLRSEKLTSSGGSLESPAQGPKMVGSSNPNGVQRLFADRSRFKVNAFEPRGNRDHKACPCRLMNRAPSEGTRLPSQSGAFTRDPCATRPRVKRPTKRLGEAHSELPAGEFDKSCWIHED